MLTVALIIIALWCFVSLLLWVGTTWLFLVLVGGGVVLLLVALAVTGSSAGQERWVQARLADQEREMRTGDSPVARAWRRGQRENRMLREFHEHGLTPEVQALVDALDEDAPLPLPPSELSL